MRANNRFLFILISLFSAAFFGAGAWAASRQPASASVESVVASSQQSAQQSTPELGELSEADKKLISSMPIREKVGQLFMIGFMGHSVDQRLSRVIQSIKPGGLVVFGRNIKSARQISNLNLSAQKLSLKAAKLPLLIAVDQEGGTVTRIRTTYPLPSALALGETNNTSLVERAGFATGSLLRTLGFNMNLAPVVDVADPSKKSFIGTRTFGSNPQHVALMGRSFAIGLHKAGVMPTAKHFPGHGSLVQDSHLEIPEKLTPLVKLKSHDLVPFTELGSNLKDPWAVMVAHIAYPMIDASGTPATFSKPIITGLLREGLGFKGVVITDDIEMAGALAIKDANERAVRAIEAGADMVMVAWNRKLQFQLVESVLKAVRSGRLSEERINESVRRIVLAKRHFGAIEEQSPSSKTLSLAIRNPGMREIAEATVLAKLNRPLEKEDVEFRDYAEDKPVFVFSANRRFYNSFRELVKERKSRLYTLSSSQVPNIDKIMRSNPDAIGVFYVSGSMTAKIANTISEDVARRILVVTTEAEGLLKKPESFRKIADVYYRHPDLGKLVAKQYFAPVPVRETASKKPETQD